MVRDEDLALGIQQGNKADLTVLVERHHSPLLGFLYRMTGGDRSLVEDLVQESFLRVLRSIHHYQYPRPFKPWLYQIATNLARDHYKAADFRHVDILRDGEMEWANEDDLPETALLSDEQTRRVVDALDDLPAHQREIVILRYFQELSLAEIADIVDVPVGTVKSRLSLGIGRLRALLVEQEVEE